MTLDEELDAAIAADIPGYEVVIKQNSKYMKTINVFAKLFNAAFMSRYTTTLYPKIYAPEQRVRSDTFWKTKAHEWVHLVKAKKHTSLINSIFYGFPQTLAPLALLSLGAVWGSSWFLLNLLWLVFLAPIPAYFRMKEELEAYAMSMACNYWRYGSITNAQRVWIAEHFMSSDYYYMWPFEGDIHERVDAVSQKVILGDYDNKHPFDKVKRIIEEHKSNE